MSRTDAAVARLRAAHVLVLLAFCLLVPWGVRAAEGGGSNYVQGTYGDFLAGVFGPPGVYYRNDLFFDDARIGARPLGGRVAAGITQHILGDLNKIAYLSDVTVLGARIGTGIVVPVIANATVSGNLSTNVPGASVFRSGTISGFGDIYVTPLIANWALGNYNLSLQPGVTVPSGGYRTDRALNLGRNYWSFDMAGSFTWFDPTRGMDISVTPGVMFNTTNQATNYHTGTEFHLDWSVGQFLSKSFGVAVVGYVYTQLESDDGTLIGPLRARDFRGSGIGVGPSAVANLQIGQTKFSLIGKALFDVESHNNFNGNVYMVSAAFKF